MTASADLDSTTCVCGHPRWAHTHYRRGSDCGTCGRRICPWFEAGTPRTRWQRVKAWFRAWASA